MDTKLLWMDDADRFAVQAKLESGRKRYADYDWIRFSDDLYDSTEIAFNSFVEMFSTRSIFSPGKIVYCYGMPFKKQAGAYHQRLAKEFEHIADNVCVIIIARPERNSSIYKAAKALGKAEEPFELNKSNCVKWITEQATSLGLKIDKMSCEMLADLSEFNPGIVQNELSKFQFLDQDGQVSPRIVEMAGSGVGATDVRDLAKFILKGDGPRAHEYLQRLFDHNEPAIKICGYLDDWLTRLALAYSADCNFDKLNIIVSQLQEWKAGSEKNDSGTTAYETISDDTWGTYSRRKGETGKMYANPKSFWYSCQELGAAGKQAEWAYFAVFLMGQLQENLRKTGHDEVRLMHEFISDLMG